jgi:hypothetical protein
VNNKIRAIQTRKAHLNLQSYYDLNEIRALNIANNGGMPNSTTTFPYLSPEKLVERSKELRLGRWTTCNNIRPSVLSTTSTTNPQSSIWPNYHSPVISSTNHMPDIHQRPSRVPTTTRGPLTEQQNILMPIDSRHKSIPKMKSSIPKAYNQTPSKLKSPFPLPNPQPLQTSHNDSSKQLNNDKIHVYQNVEEDDNVPLVMDEEFEEYLKKSTIKCADWLIKYVFDREYEEIDG